MVVQVELLEILHRLRIAERYNLIPLEIDTDCTQVLKMIIENQPMFNNIISECRYLLMKLDTVKLRHMFREENRAADMLEKEGSKAPTFEIIEMLDESDVIGIGSIRRFPINNVLENGQTRP